MFDHEKRIKDLEHEVAKVNKRLDCSNDTHEYELKLVDIPGTGKCNASPLACVTYDQRPVKVCKHCNKTINLKEVKEADNG